MQVYVVTGYNGILNGYGVVGVATTQERADQIVKDNEWKLDKSHITAHELQEVK